MRGLLYCNLALVRILDSCTGKVSQTSRDDDPPVLRALVSILVQLPIVSKAFNVSLFCYCNRLGDPLAVLPERRSLLIAPPTTKVLDHLQRVAMNGQAADTLEIGNEIDWLKPVDAV